MNDRESMAGDSTQESFQALRDRLRAVITSEFEDMSPADVAEVLAGLAGELRQTSPGPAAVRPRGDGGESWTDRLTSRLSRPAVPTKMVQRGTQRKVLIREDDPVGVAGLLHQALEVGAVLVEFETSPQLNDLINITLELPGSQFSADTQGRVVHNSPAGTAIEVTQMDREDRAALESILEDHREFVDQVAVPDGIEPSEDSYADTVQIDAESSEVESDDFDEVDVAVDQTVEGHPTVDRTPEDAAARHPDTAKQSAAFSGQPRPGSSVMLGALTPRQRRGDMSLRRQVELTDPDRRVLTSTQRALRDDRWAGKTFGPQVAWLEPDADPDRADTLVDDRILDILLQLSGSGFTGLLDVQTDQWRRQVYFDGGLAVEVVCRPRAPHEELGPMLQMADRIDSQQLGMAAAHAEENNTSVERSLLTLEILDHDRIRQAIAGRLTYLLRATCKVDAGTVRVYGTESLPAGYLPAPPLRVHVPVERIIFKRLFERLKLVDADRRDETSAEHLDSYPEVPPADRDRLERAVLNEEHSRLTDQIIAGRRRLREVFTESNLSPAETFAVVYGLHRMGVLRFDTSLHQTIVRERFRENVTVKYLSVHKASYFEVLNVHWSSYDEVIEKAYGELIDQFDPDGVPENMEDEVHQRVGEIRDRIESAHEVLTGRQQRHSYRKRIMPEYKLDHAIPLFEKQSELAERRSQWSEALDSIRRVLEIDPDNQPAQRREARLEQLQDGRLSANAAESSF